ncbi:MAG TPA: D-2-hydroxyacid dehydrogenase [Opitutaceae bacterium]|nr:D-2-hydroxyacid dehydrogenase [Opitutaceae bacterium]
MTIWSNAKFSPAATRLLEDGLAGHRLLRSSVPSAAILAGAPPDPAMAEADVAFGQPDPGDCLRYSRVRWVQVTTAGYARYDNDAFREGFRARGAAFTNSSSVFAEPAAQHVLAMILAFARQLLPSYRDQLADRSWHMNERRYASRLLAGQTVLLLGYGAIARRVAELLGPFGCTIYAIRRQARSETSARIIAEADLTRVLPQADHIVNVLPDSEATRKWVNARRLACCKKGARFYNVGRGSTVDQEALAEALTRGPLGGAYLDVTEPEPLPPGHALWSAPNCYITPHTAGGRDDQDEALVRLFLRNLGAFAQGQPLADRIV